MKVTITFLHLEHTEALDQKIREKSEKIGKFFHGSTHLRWTCSVRNGEHYAELKFHSPKSSYQATAKSENLYKSLDLVMEKLEKQITKHKSKMKNKIHRKASRVVIMDDADIVWGDFEEAA